MTATTRRGRPIGRMTSVHAWHNVWHSAADPLRSRRFSCGVCASQWTAARPEEGSGSDLAAPSRRSTGMADMPGRCALRLPATSRQPGADPRRSAERAPARLRLRGGNLRTAAGSRHHAWPTKGRRGTDAAVRPLARNPISAGRNHSFRRSGTRVSHGADDFAAAHLRNAGPAGPCRVNLEW
jgi:hypothetical protein